jgi:nucleoside-diphosphate-sugar epimerase
VRRRVLVTGATGLAGAEVLDQLRRRDDLDVVGTSRRGAPDDPAVLRWHLGAEPPPPTLRGPWDAVVHTAADVRWSLPPEQAYGANVDTVAALCQVVGPGTHVVHISTAYAGGLRGDVTSTDLADYRNSYEWSKAYAERIAGELFDRLTVIRPPLVIGRRTDGRAARFAGMYTILRGIATGTVPVIAADPQARFDLVPVDDLARLVTAAVTDPAAAGEVWTPAGGTAAPKVSAVVAAMTESLDRWRQAAGHPRVTAPPVITPERWHRFFLPFAREHLTARQNRMLDLLRVFEPYLESTVPVAGTHPVGDVMECVRRSVTYWAGTNRRLAAMVARPWRPAPAGAVR